MDSSSRSDGFVLTAGFLCLCAFLPVAYGPITRWLQWLIHRCLPVVISDNKNEKRSPEFLKGLPNIECTEGDKVQFRCKVTGYPQPRILWYKDGKRIKPSDDIRMDKIGNRDYVLSLDRVTMDEDAEFMAVAKNIAGDARTAGQLIVEPYEGLTNGTEAEIQSVTTTNTSTHSTVVPLDSRLYPEPDELLRLADQVAATRGQVSDTAENVLESADKLSSIHKQLDEMDRKLYDMEGDVHNSMTPIVTTDTVITDDDLNNNEMMSDRHVLVKEHDDLNQAASNLRELTATAMDILTTADHVADIESDAQGIKRKSDLLSPSSSTTSEEDDDLEVHFTYTEFETLYEAGLVSRQQVRKGRVKKRDLPRLEEYLASERRRQAEEDVSHDLLLAGDLPTSIDCGLKKVDSKRYKRDFVVNKNGKKTHATKWDVQYPTAEGTDVIRSDSVSEEDQALPVSEDEDRLSSVESTSDLSSEYAANLLAASDVNPEEELYLSAGKVFSLEERIRQLESQVETTDAETSPEAMAKLEDEVARTAAQVTQSNRYVTRVEQRVWVGETQSNESTSTKSTPSHSESQADSGMSSGQSDTIQSPTFELHHEEEPLQEAQPQHLSSEVHIEKQTTTAQQKPQSLDLHGISSEDVIPEVRVEADIDLPSVKNLMSKFSYDDASLSPEGNNASVKRVSDLTFPEFDQEWKTMLLQGSPGQAWVSEP